MASDPRQGAHLEEMAPTGTSIPGDAGNQRTIPSVPRPDQIGPSPADYSHSNPAHAADNAFDIPRGTRDVGATGEVMTGVGDQLSSNIEKKNLDDAGYDDRAKGSNRYFKHAKQDSDFVQKGHGGHDVEAAPGEEDIDQDGLLDRRGAK